MGKRLTLILTILVSAVFVLPIAAYSFTLDGLGLAQEPEFSMTPDAVNFNQARSLATAGLNAALKTVTSSITIQSLIQNQNDQFMRLVDNVTLKSIGDVINNAAVEISNLPSAETTPEKANEILRKWVDRVDANTAADMVKLMDDGSLGEFEYRSSIEIKDRLYEALVENSEEFKKLGDTLSAAGIVLSEKVSDNLAEGF